MKLSWKWRHFFHFFNSYLGKELDRIQLQLWAAKRRRTESQMFFSQMNEEMEETQVFARCSALLSSNERKERDQNEPRDGSWWASGYHVEVLRKFCVKVVSIRSSRPYARGHQTSLRVKVIDQMPLISDG